VVVQKDGEAIKMNSGEPEITLNAVLVKDYLNEWEASSFRKFLRGIYDKYISKSRYDIYKDKLVEETEELNNYIKSFLSSSGKY
jgi:hypothetical protein